MRIAATAAIYFAIVFGTGFAAGPVRVLLLEPRLGSLAAVAIEAPILLAAMVIGARLAIRWSGVARTGAHLLTVGLAALVAQQVADVGVGTLLRGMTLSDHIRQFATAPGALYAALLVAFAVMPWATARRT